MRRTILTGLALAACATAAPAFAAAPTTPATDAPVSTDPTSDQIAAWIADDPAAQNLTPDGAPLGPAPPERRIHGEVGAMVGNRGYGGYAAVQLPVGQASEVDVAVAGEHVDGYRGWRGGDRKSLALAVVLDGRDLARLIGREKCNVSRWGVKLKHDPVVLPDGSCIRPDTETAEAGPAMGPTGRSARAGYPR